MAKATQDELELHDLVQSKDGLALSKLCDAHLESTVKKVKEFNWKIHSKDENLIADVVFDSFRNYCSNPDKFNPEKKTLADFLVMNAEGDLKNEWVKRKKENKRFHMTGSSEELEGHFDNVQTAKIVNLDSPDQKIINKEAQNILNAELKKHFESESDIEMANLILSKERDTEVFVEILGITHLKPEEQQKEVKRQKDRIKKILVRKIKKVKQIKKSK